MSARHRVRNTRNKATGTIEWRTPSVASVKWDNPLNSGPRIVPLEDLEELKDE